MEQISDAEKDNNFGSYLRELRMEKGWSINEAGERLGVSANYISMIERGVRNPTNKFVEKIAKLYDVDEEIIYGLLGRISDAVLKSIEESDTLRKIAIYVSGLSKEQKKQFEEKVLKVYKEFTEEHL